MKPKRKVPFFDYTKIFTSDEKSLKQIFLDIGRRGAFIQQRDLEEFEERVAAYVNAKHVLGMANATDALHLSVRALGIGHGDEVIFCSHTMVATAAAVFFAGAKPVPVDCGRDHLMEPSSIEAAITPRTKAILPTQLNGRICDMEAIQSIAKKHHLQIIEDAAQALGARYKNKFAGTFGATGCISFYPAKTLGCLGDGGCVITDDDNLYNKLRQLRDHGRDESGEVRRWGLNSRLDNLQAAILNHKLQNYTQDICRRREIATTYHERLHHLPELRLPPPPASEPHRFDIFQNYELEANNRDQLQAHLADNGIGTLIQWGGKAVHEFKDLGFSQKLDFTERLFQKMLMLPMNTTLSDADVEYICDCVEQFYSMGSGFKAA